MTVKEARAAVETALQDGRITQDESIIWHRTITMSVRRGLGMRDVLDSLIAKGCNDGSN